LVAERIDNLGKQSQGAKRLLIDMNLDPKLYTLSNGYENSKEEKENSKRTKVR